MVLLIFILALSDPCCTFPLFPGRVEGLGLLPLAIVLFIELVVNKDIWGGDGS